PKTVSTRNRAGRTPRANLPSMGSEFALQRGARRGGALSASAVESSRSGETEARRGAIAAGPRAGKRAMTRSSERSPAPATRGALPRTPRAPAISPAHHADGPEEPP